MNVTYGQWERGLLPVNVDGVDVGFLSEDVDGWVFWREMDGQPHCYQMHVVAATRKQAVAEALGDDHTV